MSERPEQDTTAKTMDADEQLVSVLDTKEESEAMVVRGLLESAGIEALVSYLEAPQDVLPGVGGIVVRVRADDAEDAREIIANNRVGGDSGIETEAVNEEPQA